MKKWNNLSLVEYMFHDDNAEQAKEKVIELANNIGLPGLNAGPLKVSSTLERITAMVIGINIRYKKKSIGVDFSNI